MEKNYFFSFANATLSNVNFAEFEFAKAEAVKFDDFAGQGTLEKYELLKYMTLYLQPEEGQDWNRFSGYGLIIYHIYYGASNKQFTENFYPNFLIEYKRNPLKEKFERFRLVGNIVTKFLKV